MIKLSTHNVHTTPQEIQDLYGLGVSVMEQLLIAYNNNDDNRIKALKQQLEATRETLKDKGYKA